LANGAGTKFALKTTVEGTASLLEEYKW